MLVLIFIVLTIIFFVIGITFVVNGYKEAEGADSEVVKTVEQEMAAVKGSEEKLSADLIAVRKELEETKEIALKAKELEDQIISLEDKEGRYKDSITKLKLDVSTLSRTADHQAQEALGAIKILMEDNEAIRSSSEMSEEIKNKVEILASDNERLKEEIKNQQGAVKDLEDVKNRALEAGDQQAKDSLEAIEILKNQLSAQPEPGGRVQELESELNEIKSQSEQKLAELQGVVEGLKEKEQEYLMQLESVSQGQEPSAEVEQLKQDSNEQMTQSTATIENLKFENHSLQKDLEENLNKIKDLEGQLQQARNGQGGSLPDDAAQDSELTGIYSEFKLQLSQMKEAVSELKVSGAYHEDFSELDEPALKDKLRKSIELNKFFREKENILQSELTKSRIQAKGLQKICEDFKVQLEEKHGTSEPL